MCGCTWVDDDRIVARSGQTVDAPSSQGDGRVFVAQAFVVDVVGVVVRVVGVRVVVVDVRVVGVRVVGVRVVVGFFDLTIHHGHTSFTDLAARSLSVCRHVRQMDAWPVAHVFMCVSVCARRWQEAAFKSVSFRWQRFQRAALLMSRTPSNLSVFFVSLRIRFFLFPRL